MQRACGRVCIQLNLLLIYRYVQSSLDTSLYYNDPEFASPGFMLAGAGDDLPKPPAPQTTAKQQEKEKGNKLTSEWRRSVDVLCRILSEFRVVAQCFVLFLRILSEYCPLCSYCFFCYINWYTTFFTLFMPFLICCRLPLYPFIQYRVGKNCFWDQITLQRLTIERHIICQKLQNSV